MLVKSQIPTVNFVAHNSCSNNFCLSVINLDVGLVTLYNFCGKLTQLALINFPLHKVNHEKYKIAFSLRQFVF